MYNIYKIKVMQFSNCTELVESNISTRISVTAVMVRTTAKPNFFPYNECF